MNSGKLELRKLIFQIQFQPKFDLLDKRGKLLTMISQKDLYETVGLTKTGISAKSVKKDFISSIGAELTEISGTIEYKNVDLRSHDKTFKLANELFNALDVSQVIRIGLRYWFIKQVESYEELKDVLVEKFDATLASNLGGKFSDLAITLVSQENDHSVRYNLGPICRKEYANFFDKPDAIDYDAGVCFDCDFFTEKMRLDFYVENSYAAIHKKVVKVSEQIMNHLKREN